jgi:hypothetical protein
VSEVGLGSQVLVVYRDGISLRISIGATNLRPASPYIPVSKLSIAGIKYLVRLAKGSGDFRLGSVSRRHRDDCVNDESEPDPAQLHGHLGSEP